MPRFQSTTFSILFLFYLSFTASGATFTEIGDAGGTPATAQITTGAGSLDTIFATLSPDTDTDVFKVYVNDTAAFSITFNGSALSQDSDMQLYVLDTTGVLLFSDDDSGPGYLPQMNAGLFSANAAGFYLIAYNLFSSTPIGSPVTGWDVTPDPSQTGPVQINLTGTSFAATSTVPEPGSMALLGTGLGLIAAFYRRKR